MSQKRGKRDYYQVLGVPRDADAAEIKRAFRDLARKHHPDVNQHDEQSEELFKEANEAYTVLSDPKLRARYDRHGHSAVNGVDTGGSFSQVVETVDDLLGDLIGDAWKKRRQRKRGRDLRYTLEITLEEAIFGCEKTIDVGAETAGAGQTKTFSVTIPPGTKEGTVKRIKGEGGQGHGGGAAGDLHVIVRIREHSLFRREGHDIWCEVPISFAQAALGAVIDVPTIDANVRMRIPEGTQSGRVFRLRHKGIPRAGGLRGDQLVKVVVETPTGLTPHQRELLEEFARASGAAIAHPKKKSFLEKLEDLLRG